MSGNIPAEKRVILTSVLRSIGRWKFEDRISMKNIMFERIKKLSFEPPREVREEPPEAGKYFKKR
jgi:hypothetical protein